MGRTSGWIAGITVVGIGLSMPSAAQAQQRAAVGGFGSPQDAMIFYVAHGAAGACGQGCSDWIAAEGTVQFDTHKRLINILDRNAGHKMPVIIHAWGNSNLNTAIGLGRIMHDRGVDASAGTTVVDACNGKDEAECFALKRPGGPLDAKLNVTGQTCDLGCVLMLVGGVNRSLPASTKVMLGGMAIHNRLAPNVSEERRQGLTTLYGEQFRVYLKEMGVQPELLDIVDHNSETISDQPCGRRRGSVGAQPDIPAADGRVGGRVRGVGHDDHAERGKRQRGRHPDYGPGLGPQL